jgi:hypothetical protein
VILQILAFSIARITGHWHLACLGFLPGPCLHPISQSKGGLAVFIYRLCYSSVWFKAKWVTTTVPCLPSLKNGGHQRNSGLLGGLNDLEKRKYLEQYLAYMYSIIQLLVVFPFLRFSNIFVHNI